LSYRPAAIHDDALTHDTENRELAAAPLFGVVICVHDVPSQCNANVRCTTFPSKYAPTATHDDALTHDTELSLLAIVLGLGAAICVHDTPSQRNTKVGESLPL
jgi:hypothetical protein